MKAVSQILSAIIIVTISLTLFLVGYNWLKPILEKRQDMIKVERVKAVFDPLNPSSLPAKIEYLAKFGGEDQLTLEVNGLWILDESTDSIEFVFYSKVSSIAPDKGWISLTGGNCEEPEEGTVGVDSPSVVCAKADRFAGGYNITYKVYFRKLRDEVTNTIYQIDLEKHTASKVMSTGKTIRMFRAPSENLTSPKIIILLV